MGHRGPRGTGRGRRTGGGLSRRRFCSSRPGSRIPPPTARGSRSEEHTSELQSQSNLVCRLLLEKEKYTPMSPNASISLQISFSPAPPSLALSLPPRLTLATPVDTVTIGTSLQTTT